jgi:hypothetical protein
VDTDLEQLRAGLRRMAAAESGDGLQAARLWLLQRGTDALGADRGDDHAATLSLPELLARAAAAPRSPARRSFAVLIVDALTIPHLLPGALAQPRLDRAICALLENALPDVLLRARYPFAGDLDAKRQALAKLAATLDEHLHPPEPTFPPWLTGLSRR